MPPYTVRPFEILAVVVLGAAGIYLLLPKPQPRSLLAGGLLAVLALIALGFLLGPVSATVEASLFYLFSAVAVISGCLLITQRNPARAALSFALVVVSSCGLFLLLAAPFLMAATVIIYAGAIIVTFLFVLMLAQQEGPSDADARSREPAFSVIAGAVLLGLLLYVLGDTYHPPELASLDGPLQATREAAATVSKPDVSPDRRFETVKTALNGLEEWFERQAGERPDSWSLPLPEGGKQLHDRLTAAEVELATARNDAQEGKPVRWDRLREALVAVQAAGRDIGSVPVPRKTRIPGRDDNLPLSAYSGPPANVPLDEVRRDDGLRPQLPAENVGYLGRSLFTDFLIPVELGGTLLLVATVGAIAIATRRTERVS
jgi:NADH-quinone oxidoreductase subunit J